MFPCFQKLQGLQAALWFILTLRGNLPLREVTMVKSRKAKSFIGCFLGFFISLSAGIAFAENSLVPVGQTVGVTMDMKGITIVDIADVEGYDGTCSPAKDAGLRAGDVIESINGRHMNSAKDFEEVIAETDGEELEITLRRGDEKKTFSVRPSLSSQDGKYRLGVWVKDAASGIGTVTYYDPDSGEFGALGHGISENSEEKAIGISGGEILDARIVSIQKGGKGQPGELVGVFTENDKKLGVVTENTEVGIKGIVQDGAKLTSVMEPIPIAKRNEVKTGKAEILSIIEEGKIEAFEIEIQKINRDTKNPKGMVLKVTDKTLLDKTGGIVQGMSGSPIIQEGKLVGAVTHVFVNDPTRGYGIFMENMLNA